MPVFRCGTTVANGDEVPLSGSVRFWCSPLQGSFGGSEPVMRPKRHLRGIARLPRTRDWVSSCDRAVNLNARSPRRVISVDVTLNFLVSGQRIISPMSSTLWFGTNHHNLDQLDDIGRGVSPAVRGTILAQNL